MHLFFYAHVIKLNAGLLYICQWNGPLIQPIPVDNLIISCRKSPDNVNLAFSRVLLDTYSKASTKPNVLKWYKPTSSLKLFKGWRCWWQVQIWTKLMTLGMLYWDFLNIYDIFISMWYILPFVAKYFNYKDIWFIIQIFLHNYYIYSIPSLLQNHVYMSHNVFLSFLCD